MPTSATAETTTLRPCAPPVRRRKGSSSSTRLTLTILGSLPRTPSSRWLSASRRRQTLGRRGSSTAWCPLVDCPTPQQWAQLRATRPASDDSLVTMPLTMDGVETPLYMAMDEPGHLHLLIPVERGPTGPKPTDLNGLRVRHRRLETGEVIDLSAPPSHERVFTPFCRDVVSRSCRAAARAMGGCGSDCPQLAVGVEAGPARNERGRPSGALRGTPGAQLSDDSLHWPGRRRPMERAGH